MRALALLPLAAAGPGQAASFDFKAAATPVETRICANPLLGRLDDALARNYRGSLGTPLGPHGLRELKATQRAWPARRDACRTDACLEAVYRLRIDQWCEFVPATGVNWGCAVASADVR